MTIINEDLRSNGTKQSGQNMHGHLQLLPLIMNNIPQAVFWKNRDLVYLGCNQAFADDAGFASPEDIVGKTDFDMPWKEQADLYRADDRLVMETAKPKLNYEEPQTTPSGSTIWLRTNKIPIQENGETVAVLGMYEDITAHKQAEKSLQQSEATLSAALRVAKMGHWEFDLATQMFILNDQYYSLHGMTAQEAGGYQMSVQRFAQEFVYPEDAAVVGQATQQAIETTDPNFQVQTEARIMHADGRPRWVSVWFGIEKDAQGRTSKLHGVNQDITERKEAEAALKAHDEFSQKQSAIFAELARSEILYSGDIQTALAEITEASARMLKVQRSSIWYYNEAHTEIRCMDLFEQGNGHSSGTVLTRTDFPAYFKALEDEKVIAADNAHYHPATQDFSGLYLTPLGINSMLDAPIRLGGRVIGVICNEHVGPVRRWTVEEQNFAAMIVDFVTLAVETQERKRTDAFLRQSEATLSSALRVAEMGHWEFDIATQMFTFNDQYYALHGTSAQEVGGYQMSVQRFAQEFVYPEDGPTVGMATQQAIETTDPDFHVQTEARILHADGKPRWVTIWFRIEKDAQGRTIKLHGVNQDITARKELEAQVKEAFERRGLQVQLSTQVSQSIASSASLEELYERVVTQVKEQFGYYHTQLLRYDPSQEAVVLVTGYGEVGSKMLAAGHRLPMGEGLIGTAAASGETVLRSALEHDPDWQAHPLLPRTKGEIAVPIKLGGTVLGVLDVQSNVAGALDADDQLLLEGLCGQIATAIESTRLRQEMAEKLEEINRLYRAMSREAWQNYRESQNIATGFMFDQAGLRPVNDTDLADELFANIPLVVPGGEVIGNLAVADDPQRPISTEDETFLQQVSEQLALALESARLFEQTEEQRGQLNEALNIARLANWEYDVARDRFIFNDHFYSIFHTTVEEVGAYEISSAEYAARFVHPDDVPMVGQEIGKALASTDRHYNVHLEHRILFADGGVGYISVDVHIERDEQGNILRYYGANQDITERKKAEEAVKTVAGQLSEALDIARLANWEYDVTRDRFIFNDHFYSIFHTTVEEVGGYEISSEEYAKRFVHPDDLHLVGQEIGKALASTDRHYNVHLEHRILYKDGGVGYISVDVHIERDEQGNILRYYGANQDITERKLAEQIIAQRATQLATVASLSSTTSTLLDPDKLLQTVADLTKERFELYHAHIYLADESWNTLLLAAGAGEVGRQMVAEGWNIPMDHEQSIVARAARTRQSVIANDVVRDKSSSYLSNQLLADTRSEMAVPMIVGQKLLGIFDVQADKVNYFTEEDANIYTTLAAQVAIALQNARLYKEQAATVTQLRELDKLKSSFLANMSHELRTPLNSILGFTDVMLEGLDGDLTEHMDNDLRLIQKNGQHLLHLINDVLDMAKIEAGRMNLSPENFKAFEVMEEVTSITSTLASEKNLALFIDETSEQDVEIYADRTRLRQVMINLVNNAIKFTEAGKISLKVVSMPGARVLITVKDTGIGIAPDKLDAIFQEFTQVDASSTRKAGGTGLGLPISRRLVEMHGGRLWAESTGVSGEGSTFFVELPVEARISEVVEKQAS